MNRKEAQALIEKYNRGEASPEETRLLENWFVSESAKQQAEPVNENYALIQQEIWDRISAQRSQPAKTRRLWPRIAAAASILVMLSAGGFFLFKPKQQQLAKHDIPAGGNKAYITLAGGQRINVTDARTGLLAKQGHVQIIKKADGKIAYEGKADLSNVYNTVSTPVSGQHSVILPDGTYVMLDAESSITFPVQFAPNKREVKLSGHAWFVVKYNKQQPFSVLAGKTLVNDLGTQFDLNAYPDEPAVTTTLVEGSVAVNHKTIIPGQQALVQDNQVSIAPADTTAITAWKDGNFIFRNQDLKVTMRQLARWYGLTINYDHAPEHLQIGGNISRSRNLSVVLAAMEQTGEVHFKLNGRELTVTQ